MLTVTYDIGTTAVKGVLLRENGEVAASASAGITTYQKGERKEQNPDEWYAAFGEVTGKLMSAVTEDEELRGVIMSGQMQDMIPVDADGHCVGNAILYSDGRAEEEADLIAQSVGRERLECLVGNHYDGSLSFPKLLWLKRNEPERFRRTAHVLISAKDYVILKLTGQAAGDVTACATSGAMDLAKREWAREILDAAGIAPALMPPLYYPEQVVGTVTAEAAKQTGLIAGTKVYAGIGDAGATTLASGISFPGEYNINLGTSGWVAAISDHVREVGQGMFNLAGFRPDYYINVVPFLNAANIHRWVCGLLAGGSGGDETKPTNSDPPARINYARAEQLASQSAPGSNGVVCLPYLNGERFPVMDMQVRGSFLGITPQTDAGDLIRSCLEGIAFSIRQGLEQFDVAPQKISVIGGGGRVSLWNQILADVLNHEIWVYRNSEYLPALALASAVMLDQGLIADYREFTASLQSGGHGELYQPDAERAAVYNKLYREYLAVYPAVRAYYASKTV